MIANANANANGDEPAINAAHDELLGNIRVHADLLQEHYRYLQAHGLAPPTNLPRRSPPNERHASAPRRYETPRAIQA